MRVSRAHRAALMIAASLLTLTAAHAAGRSPLNQGTPAQSPHTITLTGIRVTGDAARPVVELSADAALPAPTVGVLDGPPRIYLDLPGVRVGAATPPAVLGVITRVRVALHSISPLVTRVVIDLAESRGYTLDDSQRPSGLIRISVTTRATGAPSRGLGTTAAPKALPPSAALYQTRAVAILQQFSSVVDVLEAIDQRKDVTPDRLDVAAQALAVVRDEVAALVPPADRASVHDTLRSACTFASRAVSLARAANGHDVPFTASSAAAGALILLDQARSALQPR